MWVKVYKIIYKNLIINGVPYEPGTLLLVESRRNITLMGEYPIITLRNFIQNQRFTERYLITDTNYNVVIEDYEIQEVLSDSWIKQITLKEKKERHYQEELKDFFQKQTTYTFIASEYGTTYGYVDLLLEKNSIYYIIELKKTSLKLENVKQVERYREYFENHDKKTLSFLIGTSYTPEIKEYGEENGIRVFTYEEAFTYFNEAICWNV